LYSKKNKKISEVGLPFWCLVTKPRQWFVSARTIYL